MKRIFLTSGLVLCMACPAFADLTQGGLVDGNTEAPITCTYPVLEGYSGTSTFTAKWTPIYKTITLVQNVGESDATGSDGGNEAPVLDPTSLYFVAGTSTIYTGKDANDNLTGATTTLADVITTDPRGIFVNFTLDGNEPTGSQQRATVTQPTAVRRTLDGYYANNTKYINADGTLTQDALDYAGTSNSDSTTWTAKWDKMHPSVTDPTLPGYEFVGWATSPDGTAMTNEEFAAYTIGVPNVDLYAIWDANDITITFNCDTAGNNPIPTGTYAFVPGTGATADANNAAAGSMTMAMDASGTLASSCTLPGWTFQGWSCTANAFSSDQGGASFVRGTIATNTTVFMKSTSAVTCNAVWQQNTVNLVFDVNHATTGANSTDTCSYDGDITIPANPSKVGYEFAGWEVVSSTAQQNPAPQEQP